MDDALKRALESFGRSREIRKAPPKEEEPDAERFVPVLPSDRMTPTREQLAVQRRRRLATLRNKAKSEADALFAAVGVEPGPQVVS